MAKSKGWMTKLIEETWDCSDEAQLFDPQSSSWEDVNTFASEDTVGGISQLFTLSAADVEALKQGQALVVKVNHEYAIAVIVRSAQRQLEIDGDAFLKTAD